MYDLKIFILFMSVAKILSDANCLQMIFDLTNSVLEWTNASSLNAFSTLQLCRIETTFHSYYVEKLCPFRSAELPMKYFTFTT